MAEIPQNRQKNYRNAREEKKKRETVERETNLQQMVIHALLLHTHRRDS